MRMVTLERRLAAAEERLTRVAEVLSWLAMAGLLLMAIVILVDVTLRWLVNRPLVGLEDITKLLVIVVVTACFPACALKRGNVTIRFLGEGLGARAARVLDAFGAVLFLVFLTLVAWQLGRYAVGVAEMGETTWVLRISVAPAFGVAAGLLGISALIQVVVTTTTLVRAITPGTSD